MASNQFQPFFDMAPTPDEPIHASTREVIVAAIREMIIREESTNPLFEDVLARLETLSPSTNDARLDPLVARIVDQDYNMPPPVHDMISLQVSYNDIQLFQPMEAQQQFQQSMSYMLETGEGISWETIHWLLYLVVLVAKQALAAENEGKIEALVYWLEGFMQVQGIEQWIIASGSWDGYVRSEWEPSSPNLPTMSNVLPSVTSYVSQHGLSDLEGIYTTAQQDMINKLQQQQEEEQQKPLRIKKQEQQKKQEEEDQKMQEMFESSSGSSSSSVIIGDIVKPLLPPHMYAMPPPTNVGIPWSQNIGTGGAVHQTTRSAPHSPTTPRIRPPKRTANTMPNPYLRNDDAMSTSSAASSPASYQAPNMALQEAWADWRPRTAIDSDILVTPLGPPQGASSPPHQPPFRQSPPYQSLPHQSPPHQSPPRPSSLQHSSNLPSLHSSDLSASFNPPRYSTPTRLAAFIPAQPADASSSAGLSTSLVQAIHSTPRQARPPRQQASTPRQQASTPRQQARPESPQATPPYNLSSLFGSISPIFQYSPQRHASPQHHASPLFQSSPQRHASPQHHASPLLQSSPQRHTSPQHHASPQCHASPPRHTSPPRNAQQQGMPQQVRTGFSHTAESALAQDMSRLSTSVDRAIHSPPRHARPSPQPRLQSPHASPYNLSSLSGSMSPLFQSSPQRHASPQHHVSPQRHASPQHHASPQRHVSPQHHASPQLHASPPRNAQQQGMQQHVGTSFSPTTEPVLPQDMSGCDTEEDEQDDEV